MRNNRFAAKSVAVDPVMLIAEPESLEIDRAKTAIVVVDMQNAFVSRGGMFDLMGRDLTLVHKIIEPINNIINAARAKDLNIIHIAHRYSFDLRESGGPNSGRWYKSDAPGLYRQNPEWYDKLLMRGTWGAEIIDRLKPQEGDILVEKPIFSAFFGTNLDLILSSYDLKYLIFLGTATNICVEASIRDACYLGYFPILVSDGTANIGPSYTQEATIYNVKQVYGWVTTAEKVIKAIT